MLRALTIACLLACLPTMAAAKRQPTPTAMEPLFGQIAPNWLPAMAPVAENLPPRVASHRRLGRGSALGSASQQNAPAGFIRASGTQDLGGRPAGCPRRYCGCYASLRTFGRVVADLNLAANWLRRFPRTAPASGMVAARHGHVFVLAEHVSGDVWMAYDGNSGKGRTRYHPRSIRGYAIVNPRA